MRVAYGRPLFGKFFAGQNGLQMRFFVRHPLGQIAFDRFYGKTQAIGARPDLPPILRNLPPQR
jgi:hypothetical protein